MHLAVSGRSILGASIALIGVLTITWGTAQASHDFEGFKTLGVGGLITLAIGLCLISQVPPLFQVSSAWLAAAACTAYILRLPDWNAILRAMSIVPVVALAMWVTTLLLK